MGFGGKSRQEKRVGDEEEDWEWKDLGLVCAGQHPTLSQVGGDGDRTRAGDRDGEGVKGGGGFRDRVGVEEPCVPG